MSIQKLKIRVVVNSKQPKLEPMPDGGFKVWLKAKPLKGRANQELIQVLSEYFKIPKSAIQIIKGGHSKEKIIAISFN